MPAASDSDDVPKVLADRYRIGQLLGRGGMARVYRARDISTGRTVALKQQRRDAEHKEQASELLEQEFYTLSQLSHPRIIEVYDYTKDESAPFYTMELVEGGDLREVAPIDWRRACELLCDVCSALSLLHSRGLVHRDLTLRNIRCTEEGHAKLIDFGAMVRSGPCTRIVGTPPFIAPEAVTEHMVDAQTDLFSLGAVAYYALTGRHAYRARDISGLRDAWTRQPAAPSRYAAEIPKELDALVMSLLHLDRVGRPRSAAEVMERLSAIGGFELDEQLRVHQAYLSTPTLVGRDEQLSKVRKQMLRTAKRQGGVLVVSGAPGVGRSRFLAACVLEAKLAGATALRVDARDAAVGEWGAARALAQQLVEAQPQDALEALRSRAPVLANVLPEVFDQSPIRDDEDEDADASARALRQALLAEPPRTFETPQKLRAAALSAFRDWLRAVGDHGWVLVAVDDVHRIDEPSAALVALLAHEAQRQPIGVVATAELGAESASPAVSLLRDSGASLKLRELSRKQTEELLRSVFGEVPNVRLLANRLFEISGGNPRAIMRLAQHLLDEGVVRYRAGTWTLPDRLDVGDLPETVSDAFAERVDRLGDSALELAQALALASGRTFRFEECRLLTSHQDPKALIRSLDELASAEIVSSDGALYSLSQPSWEPLLIRRLDAERARTLHARLAPIFAKSPEGLFRVAHHLYHAGDKEAAVDAMLRYTKTAAKRRDAGLEAYFEYIASLPSNWLSTSEALLAVCAELGRPRAECFALEFSLVTLATVTAQSPGHHLDRVTEQLRHDSGLDLYSELGDGVEPSMRLMQALGKARERFEATPEEERVLSPTDAIQMLAQTIIRAIGLAGRACDYALLESMPSLEPFIPLSPAVAVVELNRQSTLHVLAGRIDEARQGFLELLERLGEPGGSGIEGSDHANIRCSVMWALGSIELSVGIKEGTRWADAMEGNPLFEVNAWRLRLLNAIRQGETDKVEEYRRHLELLRIQNRPPQLFEGSYVWTLTLAQATCEDLGRLKELMPGLEAMADELETWKPCLYYARGVHQALKGSHRQAIVELERALGEMAPGRHIAWPPTAGAYVGALLNDGQYEKAKQRGDELLAQAEQERIGTLSLYLRHYLALAAAAAGDAPAAVEHAETAIGLLEALGATGASIGALYEARARVAIWMGDQESFDEWASRCKTQYRVGRNPALTAKYERLMQAARRAGLGGDDEEPVSRHFIAGDGPISTGLATLLSTCQGPRERGDRALALLLKAHGLESGFLFTMQKGGALLVAERGEVRAPTRLHDEVNALVAAEIEGMDEETQTTLGEPSDIERTWTAESGERLIPMLLAHQTRTGYAITAVAVVASAPDRKVAPAHHLLTALSKSFLEAGDVATEMVSLRVE